MKILNHPACAHQLGAPSDMQDGSCDALPVMYQTTEHGTFAVSFWQPEPQDLAEMLAGGGINLWVRAPGRQHPVVALGTFPAPPETPQQLNFMDIARLHGEEMALLAQMRAQVRLLTEENKTLRVQLMDAEGCVRENADLRAKLERIKELCAIGTCECDQTAEVVK